ncbi:MAG: 6-carboxytetrahydropterin synthase [Agarilytica sp.]
MRLFVDKLTTIDFSFLHPSRGLVGETWQVNVELHGELDSQGMVVDFGHVKKRIKRWLDEEVDHRLVVPLNSPCVNLQQGDAHNKDSQHLTWTYQEHIIKTTCPRQALTLIDADVVTTDSVAQYCVDQLLKEFPSSVEKLVITFTPEHIEGPYYHYSHGLKKHDGNCQRIAHGHRSRILIWRNGELSLEDMRYWAERWQDIYIGTQADNVAAEYEENIGFRYTAQQGEFYLELPKVQCDLISTDSTIELITQHILSELTKQDTSEEKTHFVVKAFEGIEKGAIAES